MGNNPYLKWLLANSKFNNIPAGFTITMTCYWKRKNGTKKHRQEVETFQNPYDYSLRTLK